MQQQQQQQFTYVKLCPAGWTCKAEGRGPLILAQITLVNAHLSYIFNVFSHSETMGGNQGLQSY